MKDRGQVAEDIRKQLAAMAAAARAAHMDTLAFLLDQARTEAEEQMRAEGRPHG